MNERLEQLMGKVGLDISKLGIGPRSSDVAPNATLTTSPVTPSPSPKKSSEPNFKTAITSSLMKVMAGGPGSLDEFYFPSEIIGGTCPHVAGEEEEIVWNAAAEACDTERVHVVWNTFEGRIWYLAIRSSEMGSHAFSWCPFASVLPGMKDATVMPVCYTYYSDEVASLMSVTSDGLQIFRGTGLVVRAKAERTARELGNAAVIELTPDRIMALSPVPWYSLSLFEDRARRILAALSILVATAISILSILVWLSSSVSLLAYSRDMTETEQRTENKTLQLLNTVQRLRASPMQDQLAKFTELNDGLLTINGLLEIYQVENGVARWRAIVPANVTADRITQLDGKNMGSKPEGTVIGNNAQIEYEKSAAGGR